MFCFSTSTRESLAMLCNKLVNAKFTSSADVNLDHTQTTTCSLNSTIHYQLDEVYSSDKPSLISYHIKVRISRNAENITHLPQSLRFLIENESTKIAYLFSSFIRQQQPTFSHTLQAAAICSLVPTGSSTLTRQCL